MNTNGAQQILLISNDPVVLQQLSEKIEASGLSVGSAQDIASATNAIMATHPALVIIDLGANGIDGFSLFESLRSNPDPSVSGVSVIVGSLNGDIVEIGRALRLGAVDYFVKTNFDPEQVWRKIQKHLNIVQTSSHEIVLDVPQKTHEQVKLLIIEDDAFLRELAEQKLVKENFNVTSAVDGEQGIQLAEKILPDVILLDILLPGIDGYEVLRRVRENPTLAHSRVIMLSNFGQREDIEKAMQAGANQFLIKANYTITEIVDEVTKLTASSAR